jgi:hypothetical protein
MLTWSKDFLHRLHKDFEEQTPLKKVGIVFTAATVVFGAIGWGISKVTTASTPSPRPSVDLLPPAPAYTPQVYLKSLPSPLPLTHEQKETKLAAWRKLDRQMEDFSAILKRGDQMLDTWLPDTQADPAGEASKVRAFANDVYNMRLALEATHNTMIGDLAEIGALVKEAVRPPGAEGGPGGSIFHKFSKVAEALANDMASSQKYDRQNLEDRIAVTAQLLREYIYTFRQRQEEWSATAQAQIRTLSE